MTLKLSIPQFDPAHELVFDFTFYAFYEGGLGIGRGMAPDETPGSGRWGSDSRVLSGIVPLVSMPDTFNSRVTFGAVYAFFDKAGATSPAGPYRSQTIISSAQEFGIDGTSGWFSIEGPSLEVVDIVVAYTPIGDSGDRNAAGKFV